MKKENKKRRIKIKTYSVRQLNKKRDVEVIINFIW